jgi:hypothetical protein
MIPIILLGIAVTALVSGCSRKNEDGKSKNFSNKLQRNGADSGGRALAHKKKSLDLFEEIQALQG